MTDNNIYKDKVTIGDAVLYLGDSHEITKTLVADSIITDIPYNISQESNGLRKLDYGEWDKGYGLIDLFGILADIRPTSVAVFCGDEQLSYILKNLQTEKMLTRTLAWIKRNPTIINGDKMPLPSMELCAYGKQRGSFYGGHCEKSYWLGSPDSDRQHPNQKPVDLMLWLINLITREDAIILDPYAGSGSVGVASMRLGRKFIGIEQEPEYFKIACDRIEREYNQGKLF